MNKKVSKYQKKTIYPDGSVYEGEMVAGDIREGKGKLIYNDEAYYIGEWKQNQISGYGELFYKSGTLAYKGQWLNDKFNGKGTVFADPSQHQHALPSAFHFSNISNIDLLYSSFEGVFAEDEREGPGTITFVNGEKYYGSFHGSLPHGKGTFYS